MIKSKSITIEGDTYSVRRPTGRDWVAVADLDNLERTFSLIFRCVERDGSAAFPTVDAVEDSPMALIQALDAELSALMSYEVPDPT